MLVFRRHDHQFSQITKLKKKKEKRKRKRQTLVESGKWEGGQITGQGAVIVK
jgi:hypothetical protein